MKCNILTIDTYLEQKTDPEYNFALERIKLGTCFFAIKKENGYRFYPSRFIVYKKTP